MTASTPRARHMSASTINRKLRRVNARIADGDDNLRPFRQSLRRQLHAIDRKAGGR